MERFSPVRRGSEGCTLSPATPQQECQRLQRGLQPRCSPPRSIPGSPQETPSPVHQMYGEVPGALGGYDRNPFVVAPFSVSSITQGLSGLNTAAGGSGSITQGTPQMGVDGAWGAHHMHVLNVHSHRSLTNSPISNPGSPGLDMIQEEAAQLLPPLLPKPEGHPQISVTDVLG